jgi:RND superfamily putative drug exporter
MPERWTRAVLRHRSLVVVVWLHVLLVGVAASTRLPDLLSNTFSVPGTDSERARVMLENAFGERADGTFNVVFETKRPSDEAVQREIERRLETAALDIPGGRVGEIDTAKGIVYSRIVTTLPLQEAKAYTVDLRRALRAPGRPPALVTGAPALQHDLDPIVANDLRRAELIALPIALVVLLALLGFTTAVLIPFAFAACTIAATLALVYALAHAISMGTYVTNLVVLIGLGLAIDYSLLIVYRYRLELETASSREDAVVRAMATAGRAVAFSGIAVAIGLSALLLVPVPFNRSLGVGGLLVPLVSLAGVATLQPVLLAHLGRRGAKAPASGGGSRWAALARAVTRRPWLSVAAGLAALVPAAAAATTMELTTGSVAAIPGSSESVRGFELLRNRLGPGIVAPTQIVIDTGVPGGARTDAARVAIRRLVDTTAPDREVQAVAYGRRTPYVDSSGRYARVIVVGLHDYGSAETASLVERLRNDLVPGVRFPVGTVVVAGGPPPQSVDFVTRSYDAFPWLVLAVLVITFVALTMAFRSLLLPLQAVFLNLLSVAAAYGLLVLVVQKGVGAALLGVEQADAVDAWVPIVLFALLFGLSMDYEVFLVAPMREAWDAGHDTRLAVVQGVARTGRIVTAAALIMVAVFAGFVAGDVPGLQQFGLGLALGVLIDATVVRMLLVPALVTLTGSRSWWLPARVERILPGPPSHG